MRSKRLKCCSFEHLCVAQASLHQPWLRLIRLCDVPCGTIATMLGLLRAAKRSSAREDHNSRGQASSDHPIFCSRESGRALPRYNRSRPCCMALVLSPRAPMLLAGGLQLRKETSWKSEVGSPGSSCPRSGGRPGRPRPTQSAKQLLPFCGSFGKDGCIFGDI